MVNEKRRPNIVFITTDQQRGDCLGCAGHPVLETPNLDQLASRGTVFSKAYAAVPSCTPSRAAIMTGMDQWNHGRLTMTGRDPLAYPTTLPAELSKAGYHTHAVGKMHFFPQRALYGFHSTVLDETWYEDAFFCDYRTWFETHREAGYGYRDHALDYNSWMARPSHLPEHLHPTYWTASEGINFIRRRDPTKPFFLWLSFSRPHPPFDPPQVYYDMYIDNPDIPKPVVGDWAERYAVRNPDVNAPQSMLSDREIHRARAAYYASITFIDHQIGRVLFDYKKHFPEEFNNTVFLFTSDHGEMLGDHHHWRKTYAYEGSSRVPFIVTCPETWDVPRGETIDRVVELRDVMPTLLDAAGIEIPASVDGRSVLDLIRGKGEDWREFIQGEHTVCYTIEEGMQFVTDGKEKYIWFHHTGEERFFDLATDPMECKDLSKDPQFESRMQVWRERLAAINENRGDPRGQNGRLVPQKRLALTVSPNYHKWRDRAKATG